MVKIIFFLTFCSRTVASQTVSDLLDTSTTYSSVTPLKWSEYPTTHLKMWTTQQRYTQVDAWTKLHPVLYQIREYYYLFSIQHAKLYKLLSQCEVASVLFVGNCKIPFESPLYLLAKWKITFSTAPILHKATDWILQKHRPIRIRFLCVGNYCKAELLQSSRTKAALYNFRFLLQMEYLCESDDHKQRAVTTDNWMTLARQYC